MKNETKNLIASFIIQQINNKLVPVDEKDKPGLYRIPGSVTLPIYGKFDAIDLGVGYKPKENRIAIINEGNQLDHFFMNRIGYCFSHQLLQKKTDWEHEEDRWLVMPVPRSVDKLITTLDYLKPYLTKAPTLTQEYFDEVEKSTIPEELKMVCLNFSMFTVADMEYLIEGIKINRDPQEYVIQDPLEAQIYKETGMLWLEGLFIERSMGYRKISYSEFDDTSDKSTIQNFNNVMSAVYVTSLFPYVYEVPEAEDANLIPTKVVVVIPAEVINPFTAHVRVGAPFRTFKATVISIINRIVRQNPIHEESIKIAMDSGRPARKDIIAFIEKSILEELQKPENFFGFSFGMPKVIDIDMVGEVGKKLKSDSVAVYEAERKRINDRLDAKNKIEVKRDLATANNQDRLITAKGIKEAAESLGVSVQYYIDHIWKPQQLVEQIAANKPGGVVVTQNLADKLISSS